jgi:hypothetical protein
MVVGEGPGVAVGGFISTVSVHPGIVKLRATMIHMIPGIENEMNDFNDCNLYFTDFRLVSPH